MNTTETVFAPVSSPGVLDDPMLLNGADQQHCVVDAGGGTLEHSALVVLEGVAVERHRDRLFQHVVEQCVTAPTGLVPTDEVVRGARHMPASPVSRLVGVDRRVAQSIVFDVGEGVPHDTSSASTVPVWGHRRAVVKLLLREESVLTGLHLEECLQVSGGRKSPAAAAASLVLDSRGDNALLHPAPVLLSPPDLLLSLPFIAPRLLGLGWLVLTLLDGDRNLIVCLRFRGADSRGVEVDGGELALGEGCHRGHPLLPGLVPPVVGVNPVEVGPDHVLPVGV